MIININDIKDMNNTKELLELIQKKKDKISEGRKYYYYKPPVNPEKEYGYQDGKAYEISQKEKYYSYTNWAKVLVDQKIEYSLSKPLKYDDTMPDEFDLDELVTTIGHNASLDGLAWTQLILNPHNNNLDWILVKDCNVIAVYDRFNKYLTYVIKFWFEKINDKEYTYIQIWDTTKVIEYIIYEEKVVQKKTKSHYLETLKYSDTEEEINPKGFGFIPFIPLFNNRNKESDINDVTILVEVYNQISSGFVKNVKKFEELIYILQGYQSQDLKEFTDLLREYNTIPIDKDGDLKHLEVQIPVEAREKLLNICKENIFILGRGVDPTFDFSGKDITNVFIKSFYHPLDTKCSDFEKQIKKYISQLVVMINLYNRSGIKNDLEFTRNQIFNTSEQIDNCLKSLNMTSLETVLANHPFVDDVQEELGKINQEQTILLRNSHGEM